MWCKVEMVGWGVYRVEALGMMRYIWDDYPDEGYHDGVGLLVRADWKEAYEILGIERDEKGNPLAMTLAKWEG